MRFLRLPNLLATTYGRLTAFFLLYVTEGIPIGFLKQNQFTFYPAVTVSVSPIRQKTNPGSYPRRNRRGRRAPRRNEQGRADFAEASASSGRQPLVLRLPDILGHALLAVDQALMLEPIVPG